MPNTIRADGLPSGVTFIAPAWHDQALANFAQKWQALTALTLGKSQQYYQKTLEITSKNSVKLAVVGAHLTAMPLNFQLTTRQGTLLKKTYTAKNYKLFALKNISPAKPACNLMQQERLLKLRFGIFHWQILGQSLQRFQRRWELVIYN